MFLAATFAHSFDIKWAQESAHMIMQGLAPQVAGSNVYMPRGYICAVEMGTGFASVMTGAVLRCASTYGHIAALKVRYRVNQRVGMYIIVQSTWDVFF